MVLEKYRLYRIAISLVTHLPLGLVYALASLLGSLGFLLFSGPRHAVIANLGHVLPPGTTDRQRRLVAHRVFRNFACSVADFLRAPRMQVADVERLVAGITGWEHVEATMAAGKGGIVATLHMGNWELAGAYLSLHGLPLTVAALPHKDPRVDRIFLDGRTKFGVTTVPAGGAVRRLWEALVHKRFIALLADRDVLAGGIELPFFGTATRVPYGHAKLALRTGSWIVPACSYRRPDRRLVIEMRPPLIADPAIDTEESLTTRCLAVLEEFIRARPEQWLSFDRIWDAPRAPDQSEP